MISIFYRGPRLLIIFLFGVSTISGFSQKIRNSPKTIFDYKSPAHLEISDSKKQLTVNHRFILSRKKEIYKVDFSLLRADKSELNVQLTPVRGKRTTISHDGDHKTKLNLKSSPGVTINEMVTLKSKVSIHANHHIPTGGHLVKSMIFPGLGSYKLKNGNHHILYGMLFYGALGGAYYYNGLATENYSQYLNSFDKNQSDSYYKKTIEYSQLSQLLVAASSLVWVANISTVILRAGRIKRNLTKPKRMSQLSNYYSRRFSHVETSESSSFLLDTRSEGRKKYDDAVEFYVQEKWSDAQLGLQQAIKKGLTMDETSLAMDKLIVIDLKIRAEKEIALAQQFYSNGDFSQSKMKYAEAKKIDPENLEIDQLIERIDKYLEYMNAGDRAFKFKLYETAYTKYKLAQEIIPSAEVGNTIVGVKKERDFIVYIRDGDRAFEKGDNAAARLAYEKALELKPNNPSLKSKIDGCTVYKKVENKKWYTLYEEKGDKVEIRFRLKKTCDKNTNQLSNFEYRLTGDFQNTKYNYISWKAEFNACNSVHLIKHSVPLSQKGLKSKDFGASFNGAVTLEQSIEAQPEKWKFQHRDNMKLMEPILTKNYVPFSDKYIAK